jgi:hypothetical protein
MSGLTVLLGKGDGTFKVAGSDATAGSLLAADFNGDGKLDLATAAQAGPSQKGGQISVFLGNGDGTLQPPRNLSTLVDPGPLAVGDFNRDGVPDLALLTLPGLTVFLGNGDGTFQPGPTYANGGPGALAVGDFNGDQFPDVVTPDLGVRVFLNAADWPPVPHPHPISGLAVVDGLKSTRPTTQALALIPELPAQVRPQPMSIDGPLQREAPPESRISCRGPRRSGRARRALA